HRVVGTLLRPRRHPPSSRDADRRDGTARNVARALVGLRAGEVHRAHRGPGPRRVRRHLRTAVARHLHGDADVDTVNRADYKRFSDRRLILASPSWMSPLRWETSEEVSLGLSAILGACH